MVRFRNAVRGTNLRNWWDNGSNQIAYCRGNAGLVAFNADNRDMRVTVKSSLPAGTYCDVISGNLENGRCTGKTVTVQPNGNVYLEILRDEADGVLAIHKNVSSYLPLFVDWLSTWQGIFASKSDRIDYLF